jgi:hypothetical protein
MCRWRDRITYLVNQSKFVQALELGSDFFAGTALAATGLPPQAAKRQLLVKDYTMTILQAYVDLTLASASQFVV